MSAEFIWAILIVVALLLGPFAALRAVSQYKIRMSAEQKRRQAELEREEKEAEARGDKTSGYW